MVRRTRVGGPGVIAVLMTCRHVQQLHDAYIDGELSPSLMAEMHAHLLQCPVCQQQVELTRACGSVIARDDDEPTLDAGFAARVVAALQQKTPVRPPALETRRSRRQRLWRIAAGAGLPAAAAVLFFCVLIWPSSAPSGTPRLVAGKAVEAAGLAEMVKPTLSAVADTRQAAESLNQILSIAGDDAARNVERTMQRVRPSTESVWKFFFEEPFSGLLEMPDPPRATTPDQGEELIRF